LSIDVSDNQLVHHYSYKPTYDPSVCRLDKLQNGWFMD